MYRFRSKEQHLPENNIINTSQYSGGLWKQHLNQTHYKKNHNDTHYDLNLLVNPEIAKKQHNIQLTTISEYSNAMHNKTVFVNPKNISCWYYIIPDSDGFTLLYHSDCF